MTAIFTVKNDKLYFQTGTLSIFESSFFPVSLLYLYHYEWSHEIIDYQPWMIIRGNEVHHR